MHHFSIGMNITEPKVRENMHVYNPYPVLGAPDNPSWPRGYPMDLILQQPLVDELSTVAQQPKQQFGVLQSLADYQPDVDAVYRLTQKTPFVFNRPPLQPNSGTTYLISLYNPL